jgi:mevalonate kinase
MDPSPAVAGRGRAFGKLILCGEHAVVYGHPALAVAVDRATSVALRRRPGPTDVAPGTWSDARLRLALREGLGEEGWEVAIHSELPVGRGMGSSAALSVAVIRAWAAATGASLEPGDEHARAMALERVFHGNPSGLDHAMAARGGAVRYTRGEAAPILVDLPPPAWRLAVLDSGTAGDTRALVAGVAARRPGVDPALDAIGALVPRAEAALADPAALGPLLTENHALLRRIGVSTPALDRLVDLARSAGAHGAKLAGAGGGGVVIALGPDPDAIVAAARAAGVDAFTVGIGRS